MRPSRQILDFLHDPFIKFHRQSERRTRERIQKTFDFKPFRAVQWRFVQILQAVVFKFILHIRRSILPHAKDFRIDFIQSGDNLESEFSTIKRIALRSRLMVKCGIVSFRHQLFQCDIQMMTGDKPILVFHRLQCKLVLLPGFPQLFFRRNPIAHRPRNKRFLGFRRVNLPCGTRQEGDGQK